MMQKRIKLILENITKAKDKKYVNDTIDSIIDSLHDFPYAVSNIGFHRDKDIFYVKFNLRVCKTGDMVWCLIQEFLSCVVQTENKVNVTIDSVEEGEVGITYKLYAYKSKEDEM
jgi:hypothetical protein